MTTERPTAAANAPAGGPGPKFRISTSAILTGILALAASAFVLLPFFSETELVRRAVRHAMQLLLAFLVWRHSESRALIVVVVSIVLLDGVAEWAAAQNPSLAGARLGLSLAFFAITTAFIGRSVWTANSVTAELLPAAVAVYFLLGLCWGIAFSLVEYSQPGSFANACESGLGRVACAAELARFPRLYYFSFVTITTLGYGDITPQTRAAEGVATMAAITGQLFLAVLIGKIVGMYVAHHRGDRQQGD